MMAKDPQAWLAAAVRTLLRRVAALEAELKVKEFGRTKNVR